MDPMIRTRPTPQKPGAPLSAPKAREKSGLPPIIVRLAAPRGFCAGVERAIRTVEEALAHYGPPVYVRHEIVHNTHVVARLSAMGAIFVDSLTEAPTHRPIIFSAHGAPQSTHNQAALRQMIKIDATCPLVLKVHAQARRFLAAGYQIVLIGHKNHPEVIGTLGQAPKGAIHLLENLNQARAFTPGNLPLAYATQTTLSVDDTRDIIALLKQRFPDIVGPAKDDICYATSNRQSAVKAGAPGTDLFVVIGSQTSSNSLRLVETAHAAGAKHALLTEDASQFDWSHIDNVHSLGLSAGASVPERLVEDFLTALASRRSLKIETITTASENMVFNTPLQLAS